MIPEQNGDKPPGGQHNVSFEVLRYKAAVALEEGLRAGPGETSRVLDQAQRNVVKLRDKLILELRKGVAEGNSLRMRKPLDKVNVAISLIAGVEYPAAGIQRQYIEDALEVLQELETLL